MCLPCECWCPWSQAKTFRSFLLELQKVSWMLTSPGPSVLRYSIVTGHVPGMSETQASAKDPKRAKNTSYSLQLSISNLDLIFLSN